MRLIDADVLLEKYNLKDATKYENKDAEQQEHSYSTMMMYEIADMIEDAPTAYDVDKVVKQLEKEFRKYYGENWKKAPYLVNAIEFVRSGGKEYQCRKYLRRLLRSWKKTVSKWEKIVFRLIMLG